MSDPRPGGSPRPFTTAEIDGATGAAPEDVVASTRVARELEQLAAQTPMRTTAGFTDRVMAAVTAEPAPAPARLAGRALRRGSLGAFLGSLRDAWQVSVSPGFPMAARAQAMVLVLVVAGLAAGSGMALAGALGLLDGDNPSPAPPVEQISQPVTQASPDATPPPALGTDGSMSPEPSESAEPSRSPGEPSSGPDRSSEPAETDGHDGSDDDHGATATPEPDDDHDSEPTGTPSATSGSDDDEHASTPEPTRTPQPSQTPSSDGSSGSSSGDG